MRRLEYNINVFDEAKSNAIQDFFFCKHCGSKSLRFEISHGGFVKYTCLDCGKENLISKSDLDLLPAYYCPECRREIKPEPLEQDYNTYCYTCEDCDLYFRLADILTERKENL